MVVVGEFEGDLFGVGGEGNALGGGFKAEVEGERHEHFLPEDARGVDMHGSRGFVCISDPLSFIDGLAGEEGTL